MNITRCYIKTVNITRCYIKTVLHRVQCTLPYFTIFTVGYFVMRNMSRHSDSARESCMDRKCKEYFTLCIQCIQQFHEFQSLLCMASAGNHVIKYWEGAESCNS